MKRGKKESGFPAVVVMVAAICGALIGIGLMIPALHPLAIKLGTAFSLVIIAVGIGVALYAGWRIITFPYRRRKTAAAARAAGSRPFPAGPASRSPVASRRWPASSGRKGD